MRERGFLLPRDHDEQSTRVGHSNFISRDVARLRKEHPIKSISTAAEKDLTNRHNCPLSAEMATYSLTPSEATLEEGQLARELVAFFRSTFADDDAGCFRRRNQRREHQRGIRWAVARLERRLRDQPTNVTPLEYLVAFVECSIPGRSRIKRHHRRRSRRDIRQENAFRHALDLCQGDLLSGTSSKNKLVENVDLPSSLTRCFPRVSRSFSADSRCSSTEIDSGENTR